MFCSKCGCHLLDDVQFCSNCGTRQRIREKTQIQQAHTSKELDRSAIKIYLDNLLALEYAIEILKQKWDEVKKEILMFEENNYLEILSYSEKEKLGLFYDGKKYYMHFNVNGSNQSFIGMHWAPFLKKTWEDIEENWDYINRSSNWPSTYKHGDSIIDMLLIAPIIESAHGRARKNWFLQEYESFKARAPRHYAENLKKIEPQKKRLKEIDDEMTEAVVLLQSAYAVNIIPQQFRNIYAIWFIHNYITTSQETLTSALLHCDMDSIKHKLDTIINQQRDIIMNQAILAAQNSRIIEQNQQSLRRLADLESNAEKATQYAQIAASNAEACAWIGVSNYLQ